MISFSCNLRDAFAPAQPKLHCNHNAELTFAQWQRPTIKTRTCDSCTSSRDIGHSKERSSRQVLPTRPSAQAPKTIGSCSATKHPSTNTAFSTRRCAASSCDTKRHSARCDSDLYARVTVQSSLLRSGAVLTCVGFRVTSNIPHHDNIVEWSPTSITTRPASSNDRSQTNYSHASAQGWRTSRLYLHLGSAGTRTVG
jgi:hypothetical protein